MPLSARLHHLEASQDVLPQIVEDGLVDPPDVEQQRHHRGGQLRDALRVLDALVSEVLAQGVAHLVGRVRALVVPTCHSNSGDV